MKITKSTEIKVGAILFFGLLILIAGIILGKGINITSRTAEIKFLFPNSGGIKVSDPISINGVAQGSVKSITNLNDSVLIIGSVDDIRLLKEDAKAQIMILEITGGKKIEIYPGHSSKPFNSNRIIYGSTPPDLAELVAIFGNASSQLLGIISKLDTSITALNSLIVDSNFTQNLKSISFKANELITELNSFTKENSSDISAIINSLNTITKDLNKFISTNNQKFEQIVENLNEISNDAKPMISKTNSLLSDLTKLTNDLQGITQEISNGDGTLSKLIYDKELAQSFDNTIVKLDSLMKVIMQYGVNVNVRLGSRP